jgi:hypothetical protein
VSDLPNRPAVYALYGGSESSAYVAYVGIAGALETRIDQHLVRRDSSVTTGVSAVRLNPDYVTEVRWWEHPDFGNDATRTAAELVAFDVLNPVLRSRGAIRQEAKAMYGDQRFADEMRQLFQGPPTGRLRILTLQDALDRIAQLEQQVADLRAEVSHLRQHGG